MGEGLDCNNLFVLRQPLVTLLSSNWFDQTGRKSSYRVRIRVTGWSRADANKGRYLVIVKFITRQSPDTG